MTMIFVESAGKELVRNEEKRAFWFLCEAVHRVPGDIIAAHYLRGQQLTFPPLANVNVVI